jgi:heat shock protein beta
MFKDIAADEDPSKYIMFWNNFGKYLKVGVIDDEKNKDELVPLLRFFSSKSGEEYTSFDKYVEGMPEGQKSIYYVTGEGRKNAMLQPVIEKFASRGYEVLLMTEPLDEITIENIRKYKDFDVVDATKEGLDLEEDEESKKEAEELNEKYAEVREYLEVELEGKVQKVKVSKLLTNSPAALVQGAYGVSPTMQRYMKAQSVASGGTGNLGSMNQAVLEINPNHPIVIDLERMIKKDKESPETKNFAMLMYDIASLTGGYEISDTGDFAKRVMSMMTTKAKDDVAKDDDDEEKPSSTEDSKASDDNEDKAVDPEVIV